MLKNNNTQILTIFKLRNISLTDTITGVIYQMIRVMNRMIEAMH